MGGWCQWPFGYRSFSGTGEQTNSIGSVTGSVTVSITKGGKILASQSTSAPYGEETAVTQESDILFSFLFKMNVSREELKL